MTNIALILDGGRAEDASARWTSDRAVATLTERGWNASVVRLHEIDIAPCLGCFGCWIKTPGVCVIDDAGRGVARQIAQSDLVVLLTPIVFGGPSPELKKALDRMIGNILPFFRTIKGEVHHVKRYAKYARLVGLGLLPAHNPVEEELFDRLIRRNAINMHAPATAVEVICARDEEETKARRIEWALTEAIDA